MTESNRRPAASATVPLTALVVVALTLRPQLSAVGPLAPGIGGDLGVSHAFVGLLTTIPVLCMGIFAPFGPGLARLTGVRWGILVSVAILVGFALLRPFAGDGTVLLVLTFGIGVGTAVVGPILPMYVRARIPAKMVAGTAAYAAGITIGAAIASTLAVPLETMLGGWRGSLLALSLASVPAVVAWWLLVRSGAPGATQPPRPSEAGPAPTAVPGAQAAGRRALDRPRLSRPNLPVRRGVAWLIGVLFGMQSWLYYGAMAWLASVYIERGWDPALAALLLTLVSVASLSGNVLVPWASGRGLSRRALLVAAALCSCVGLAGVALLPAPAPLWATILGIGLGVTFTLVLTLPTDISATPKDTGGAAALMFLVGYLIASVAPFVLGAVRDATGDFVASLWLLVAIAAAIIPLAWLLTPRRLRPAGLAAGAPAHREAVPPADPSLGV